MSKNTLSPEDLARYNRQIILPEIGLEGQIKLKNAKVLIIGAGGLGSPVLLYLTAAGVGEIGIIDHDRVDESNLHRQVLFQVGDINQFKSIAAKAHLEKLNPHIKIEAYNEKLTSQNALSLFNQYDLIIDGTDNFPTRYLVNDACVLTNKPYVYASISQFEGQVTIFNYTDASGKKGPNYRDLFPEPPAPGSVPSCAEGGVLGVLPGILGSFQANEAIKIITESGQNLSGRLFVFNALHFTSYTLKIKANEDAPPITKLIDYDIFCGLSNIPTISALDLEKWISQNHDMQIIDVREMHEYLSENIGAVHIPLAELSQRINEINDSKKIVLHCKMGGRSAQAFEILQAHGFNNIFHVEGGIEAIIKSTKIPVFKPD